MEAGSVSLYGVAELARAAGVRPRTLAAYLARGLCPEPDVRLECGPVWLADSLRTWQWWLPEHEPSARSAAQALLLRAAAHEWPGCAVNLISVEAQP